jgi:hypothetical protein
MPRRQNRGSRSAIEAALSAAQRQTLADLTRGAGIPPDRWVRVDAFFQTFAGLALANEIARHRADGHADDRAEDRAALDLGISRDTAASWRRRWISYAYRPAA